ESHGNAVGVGLAEVVHSRIISEMDSRAMYTNALSAMTPATVRVPMHFDTDAECLKAVLRVAGADPEKARIVRVRNTLAVDRFVASEAYAAEVAEREDLTVVVPPRPWTLDAQGNFDPAAHLPGPRLGVGWLVWAWAVLVLMTLLQVGAMFGGVAQVMALVVPAIGERAWVLIFLALTLVLLLGGGYARIERLAVVKVALFT